MFTSTWKLHLAALAALLSVLTGAHPSYARCDPTTDPDKADIANARAAVAANCNCELRHGAYVSCAAQQAKAVLTNKSCTGFVKKCASHSTCGKPNAVTCCLTTAKGTSCKVKPDAAHCTAKQGTVGSCTSCCDACPAPGGGPSCLAPSTTTTTTTTTSTMLQTCSTSEAPACGGTCPSGQVCGPNGFNFCSCFSPGDCGLSSPSCGGTCPTGSVCMETILLSCGCVSPDDTCEVTASPPTCNGTCPPGRVCISPGGGPCTCAPVP